MNDSTQPRSGPLEHFPGEPEHVFPEPVDRYLDWRPYTHAPYPVQSAAAVPQHPSDPGALPEGEGQ